MFQINIFMYFLIKMEKDSVIILNSKKEKKPFFQIILICGLTVLAFIFLFILIWFFKDNKKPSEIGIDVALLNKQQEELQKELEEAKQQRIIESAKNANIDNSIRIQEKIKLFKNLDFEDSKQIKLNNLTDEYAYNMNFLIETITNNIPPENPNDFLNLLSILYKNKYFAQNIIGIKDTFYSYLFDRSLLSVNYFSEKEIRDNNEIQCANIQKFDKSVGDFCFHELAISTKNEPYCNNIIGLDDKSDCIFKTATSLWKGEYNPYKDIQSCLNDNKTYNYIMTCFKVFKKQQGTERNIIDLVKDNKSNLKEEDYKKVFQDFVYDESVKDISKCKRIEEIGWDVKKCEQHSYENKCQFDFNISACKNIENKEKLAEIYKESFFILLDADTDKKYCEQMDQSDEYALNKCWDFFYFKSSKKYSWSKKKEDIYCSKIKDPVTKSECETWINNVNNPKLFWNGL